MKLRYLSVELPFQFLYLLLLHLSIIMMAVTGDRNESQPSTSSTVQWSQPCRHFEFAEILLATENFDESLVIGHGGFGKVYKGNVINGSTPLVAAIKRLDSSSNQGASEFWAEVETLSKLRHCHLVSLIGYCNYEREMILVYEYMPNGTLADHLHKLGTPLYWLQRLKICIGTARGLDYLHTGMGIDFGIIHRDVKSSNILLHESWAAKISDFGLSRIGPTNQPSTYVNTLVKGTFGYLDPDYFFTGRLTRKSDVYAFGVVLLEVLCRKHAVDRSLDEDQWNLARWAQESIKQGNLKHIIDSDIRGEIFPKCLKEFVQIAKRCLHSNPKQRPTMAEVVVSLQAVLTLQEKKNNSLQTAGTTLFGRMVDMYAFPAKGENPAHGDPKLTSTDKGNNTFPETREVPADCTIPSPSFKVFKFSVLKRATSNFSRDFVLHEGNYEKMYLGWLDKNTFTPSTSSVGIAIAIRWLHLYEAYKVVNWEEDGSLRRLAHPNIIGLLGYCDDKKHGYLLVYEYMQTHNFGQFLYGDVPEPLSWGTRLSIMIGVSRGLAYLHSFHVLCPGVKSNHILLDQDFNAKLAGFGPEIKYRYRSTMRAGSSDHMDPNYYYTGRYNAKSDIYYFGLLLLETLTGLQVVKNQRDERVHLACQTLAKETELKKIMDPRLEQNYPEEGAFECFALALRCLEFEPKDRPSSEEVLLTLEHIYGVHK